MPNWCNNTLTLTHEDPNMIQRAIDSFKEGKLCQDNPFYGYESMHTSMVVSINEDRTEVETLNSIYKLQDERK